MAIVSLCIVYRFEYDFQISAHLSNSYLKQHFLSDITLIKTSAKPHSYATSQSMQSRQPLLLSQFSHTNHNLLMAWFLRDYNRLYDR